MIKQRIRWWIRFIRSLPLKKRLLIIVWDIVMLPYIVLWDILTLLIEIKVGWIFALFGVRLILNPFDPAFWIWREKKKCVKKGLSE